MTSPLKSDLFTDKPISLSVKDYLIRRMAVKMRISEKVIEAVVNHQFQSAHEALGQYKSVEISGFGKFFFNDKKAVKLMQKFVEQKAHFEKMVAEGPEAKKESAKIKLQMAIDGIRDLKPKIYDLSDLRGVEEQPAAAQSVEENDKGDK